jgi:predicted ATP-binding protein involved in virulence
MARIDLLTLDVPRLGGQDWNVSFQWEPESRADAQRPWACVIHIASRSITTAAQRDSIWCVAVELERVLALRTPLPEPGIERAYWYLKGICRCYFQRFEEAVRRQKGSPQPFVLGLDDDHFFLAREDEPEPERITREVTGFMVEAGRLQRSASAGSRPIATAPFLPEPREWPLVEPELRDAMTPTEQAAYRALREFYSAWHELRGVGARPPEEAASSVERIQEIIGLGVHALAAVEEWRHLALDSLLARLDEAELARLSAYLLELDGWTVNLEVSLQGRARADILAEDSEGRRLVAECKTAAPDLSRLQEAALQLSGYQKLAEADQAVLVTSSLVDPPSEVLAPLGIGLWDRRILRRKILRDPRAAAFLNELTGPPKTRQAGQLQVLELRLENFRGVSDMSIRLDATQTTIFVGRNGTGKTTMLEAVAKGLSWLTQRVANPSAKGLTFRPEEIKNGTRDATIVLRARVEGTETSWSLVATEPGVRRVRRPDLTGLRAPITGMQRALEAEPTTSLPIAVLYPVNRAVIEVPLRIRKRHEFGQLAAYADAWTTAEGRNFRLFFEWFRLREDIENERRVGGDPGYRDPQIEAVRQAIYALMPEFADLRIQRAPQRMLIDKQVAGHRERVIVNQLSDGEKCLLAMVGDLARRLAIANPGLEQPLHGSGVVLIDEIDLHLHPRWQREIVSGLERTFPNCQFILTTHSPQVLSQVRENAVVLLGQGERGIEVLARSGVYGWDTNRILEELMETSPRPPEVQHALNEYFALINAGRVDEAKGLRTRLEREIGQDEPSFKKADVLLRYRERVAGS